MINKYIYFIILFNNILYIKADWDNLNIIKNIAEKNKIIETFIENTEKFYNKKNSLNSLNKKDLKKIEKDLNNLKKILIKIINEKNKDFKNKELIDILKSEEFKSNLNNYYNIFNINEDKCKKKADLEKSNIRYARYSKASLFISVISLANEINILNNIFIKKQKVSNKDHASNITSFFIFGFLSLFLHSKSNEKENEINILSDKNCENFELYRKMTNIFEEIKNIEEKYNKII